jgi:hypothetical protein
VVKSCGILIFSFLLKSFEEFWEESVTRGVSLLLISFLYLNSSLLLGCVLNDTSGINNTFNKAVHR